MATAQCVVGLTGKAAGRPMSVDAADSARCNGLRGQKGSV